MLYLKKEEEEKKKQPGAGNLGILSFHYYKVIFLKIQYPFCKYARVFLPICLFCKATSHWNILNKTPVSKMNSWHLEV